MSTYAIGDIQGCYDPLCRLLEKIDFNDRTDQLWFAGDLVNRGPKSLETLYFVKSLGDSCTTVLGNHDIHLLALYYGLRKRKYKDGTLFQVLDAKDADELIHWIQTLPVAHIENGYVLTHAGIHPHWSIDTLISVKSELETEIRKIASEQDLAALYGNTEGVWRDAENSQYRLRYALNCLTRMRYCDAGAAPEYECSAAPGEQPANLTPWFEIPNNDTDNYTILFGHWAALGYHHQRNFYALDSGCVWGNKLTALRLEDKQIFSVSCSNSA